MLDEDQVYGRIGEDGFQRLAAAFYKQVPADGHPGSHVSGMMNRE